MSKVVGYSRTVPVRAVEGPSSPSSPGMTNLAWKTMIKGICQSLSCVVCVTRARFADTGTSQPQAQRQRGVCRWNGRWSTGAHCRCSAAYECGTRAWGRRRSFVCDAKYTDLPLGPRSSRSSFSSIRTRPLTFSVRSDHGQFYILGAYLQKPAATKLLSAVRCPVPQSPVRRPPTSLAATRASRSTPKPESLRRAHMELNLEPE